MFPFENLKRWSLRVPLTVPRCLLLLLWLWLLLQRGLLIRNMTHLVSACETSAEGENDYYT